MNASDGVMRTFPPAGLVVAVRFFASVMMFMKILQSWATRDSEPSVAVLF
jgi:hypothetical protein